MQYLIPVICQVGHKKCVFFLLTVQNAFIQLQNVQTDHFEVDNQISKYSRVDAPELH